MCLMGTIRDGKIVLDEQPKLPDGTRVEVVAVAPDARPGEPRPGSPEAVLRLAGTLTDAEADAIMKVVDEQRQADRKIWEPEAEEG
jgi:hypothetical protein